MEGERALGVLLATIVVAGAVVTIVAVVARHVARALREARARRERHLRQGSVAGEPPVTYRHAASQDQGARRPPAWPAWVAFGVGAANLAVGVFLLAAVIAGGEPAGATVAFLALAVGIAGLVAAVRIARRRRASV